MFGEVFSYVSSWFTAPEAGSINPNVFWTGIGDDGTIAKKWAESNGGITLEMSSIGKNLPKWSVENEYLWIEASTNYAKSARGDVTVLIGTYGISESSYFYKYELPELLNNPNVTSINYINLGR